MNKELQNFVDKQALDLAGILDYDQVKFQFPDAEFLNTFHHLELLVMEVLQIIVPNISSKDISLLIVLVISSQDISVLMVMMRR